MWHEYIKFSFIKSNIQDIRYLRVIWTFSIGMHHFLECHYPLFSSRNKVLEIQKTLLSSDFMQDPLMRYSKTMKFCALLSKNVSTVVTQFFTALVNFIRKWFIYVRFLWDYNIWAVMKISKLEKVTLSFTHTTLQTLSPGLLVQTSVLLHSPLDCNGKVIDYFTSMRDEGKATCTLPRKTKPHFFATAYFSCLERKPRLCRLLTAWFLWLKSCTS